MKTLKKTLALIAALTVVATTFAACGDKTDEKKSETTDAPKQTEAGGATTEPPVDPDAPAGEKPDDSAVKVKTGGDTFTIVAWNSNDFPALLNAYNGKWDGVSGENSVATATLAANKTTPTGKTIEFIDLDCGGQDSQATYNNMLAGGKDLDIFAAEADFALNYIGDSSKSTDLTELGFKESDWANAYKYTMEIGKNSAGEIRGISWQACPGGYAYRSDLAEQYLGAKNPDEMQAKVKDWATMEESAKTVMEASGNKTAMAATMGGIWQVFSTGRTNAWVKDGKLVADDPATLDYIDMIKRWSEKGYVTKATQWNDAWKQLGQDDSTMGYFVSTWGFGDTILLGAAGGKDGPTYKKWNVVVGPQKFYWGGTWIIVNPATDNGIEAKDFIWALTVDEDTMKQYAIKKGEYVNNKKVIAEVQSDPAVADSTTTINLGGQNWYALLAGVADTLAIDAKQITKYDASIKSQFNTAVEGYVNGKTATKDATIEAFKDGVAKDVTDVEVD